MDTIPFIVGIWRGKGCDSLCHGGLKAGRWPVWSTEYSSSFELDEPYRSKWKIMALDKAG